MNFHLGMVEKCVYFSAFNDMKDSGKLNGESYLSVVKISVGIFLKYV